MGTVNLHKLSKPCHIYSLSGLFSLKGTCAQFTNRGGEKTAGKAAGLGRPLSKSHPLWISDFT